MTDTDLILDILSKNDYLEAPIFERGRSPYYPIVIDQADGYVKAEHLVAKFLLFPLNNRLKSQSLLCLDGRYVDCLVFETVDKKGNIHEESFYFDISTSYNAIKNRNQYQ